MPLLSEYSVKATPDRRVVQVYDADAYLGGDDAWEAAKEQVVGGDGRHLYFLSIQPVIDATVTIRVWDAPPAPPTDAEGYVPVTLESPTGMLVVNQLTMGPAGDTELPRPGVYEGHAWWTGRQATADYYNQVLSQPEDDEDFDLDEAWEDCPAEEHYTLDLAFTRELAPADNAS
ncbi:hypothetical protein [Streptomyces sp. NPDC006879]|uniref:hypothetical protein n=1 Tax=Streptomyces sp. NPDC006879 TaxID=3364767 RepID=UPI00367F1416